MPKLRQNSTSVGASIQTPLGSSQRSPRPLAAFKGRSGKGWKGNGREEEREGEVEEGRGGKERGKERTRRENSHFKMP